jgi:biotin carboxyl carrier protein
MVSTRMLAGGASAVLVLLLAAQPGAPQTQSAVARAAISGEVLPLQLAVVGQAVHQGDPLVFVSTMTGAAVPAARAPADGQVVEVLVHAGDHVNIGDPVVVIRPQ